MTLLGALFRALPATHETTSSPCLSCLLRRPPSQMKFVLQFRLFEDAFRRGLETSLFGPILGPILGHSDIFALVVRDTRAAGSP